MRVQECASKSNARLEREDGVGFDKSKVEFYKCHLKGHFARECRSGVSHNNHQQAQTGNFNQNRNSAQALVSQQGMGFDLSDQAEEAIQNQALMAEVSDLPTEGKQQLKGKSIWHVDSGCSRHMTGNMACLKNFKKIDGRHVAFGNTPDGGKISGKGDVTKGKMAFEDVYYVEQLRYNLLSVSQVCDKKHSILFTDSECIILAPGFKVVDEKMILLRTPRKDNVYCLDMENVSNDSSLNCLVSKASLDESSLWHRRMCHMNFKTMNKLVKNNLVRNHTA
ncbi:hypothetical protein L6452_08366 [Arctium lappa]|uniref:Uncharacterized protein n=1 Tax=Arctium lappa TaxID=4217 RepID=A0ACB9DHW9_ARCLA|nr:hypothetical protein L6452_08366 [Arctium lappa]